jgi:hypothetical protein
MPCRRLLVITLFCFAFYFTGIVSAKAYARQEPIKAELLDTDRDGLSDRLEQTLLEQFEPSFLVGKNDCSNVPSEFLPNLTKPTVEREDGTIYGQAFIAKVSTGGASMVELHFYDLWKTGLWRAWACARHGTCRSVSASL